LPIQSTLLPVKLNAAVDPAVELTLMSSFEAFV
jgi:hypothetical protein